MPGIRSEVYVIQYVPTLDLGKFQDLRRLSPECTYITRTRAYEFTYALDGNHRCAPGSTLTCSCTGPLVNFWSTPAASLAIRPSSPPSPICWPLRKTSDKVEDRSSHPANLSTSRSCTRVFYFAPSPFAFFFFFLSSLAAVDPPSLQPRWIPVMCRIELDMRADTTFTIGGRLSCGDNKIKRAILHPKEAASVPMGGYVSHVERMNRKSCKKRAIRMKVIHT